MRDHTINAKAHPSPNTGSNVGNKRSRRAGLGEFWGRSRLGKSRPILARIVEVEAIPRIVLTQRAVPLCATQHDEVRFPNPRDVEEFATLALAEEVDVLSAYVEAMRARGASLEQVYLELVAPAARRLENFGTEDLFALTEATIGLGRLQRLLHQLNRAFEDEGDRNWHGRQALIMPAPGEQHSFDLFMVGACLRRTGWEVSCWPTIPSSELFAVVGSQLFAMVWLSASREHRIDALARVIRRIRRVSQNPDIGVVVGGPLFIQRPELATSVGADALAVDGRQAALQAQNILDLLPSISSDQSAGQLPAEPVGGLQRSKAGRTTESVSA